MRIQFIVTLSSLLFSFTIGYGQIITIVEKNNGRVDTVKINGPQIVDINGNLEIAISKGELVKKIRLSHPEFSDELDLQERIQALDSALTNQENLLKRLKQETLNKADKKAFYGELSAFYKSLLKDGNDDLRAQANALYAEWRKKYGPRSGNRDSGLKKEVYILTNFNNNLNLAKQDLANMKGKSFNVSMIAFVHNDLGKNRVHIENFDNISENEIYTVPRWVTNISTTQEAKLKDLQKRADKYNEEAPEYFAKFKAELLSKLPDISCIGNLKTDIQKFIKPGYLSSDITVALKSDVDSVVAEIDALTSLVSLVTQDISSWTIATPFQIIELAQNLVSTVNGIDTVFDKFKTTSAKFENIESQVLVLVKSFDTCYKTVSNEINGLTQAIGILKNQQNRFKDNDEIGDEVTKFTLNTLPSTGFIKLKRSGPRVKGDNLEIVLVLRLPQQENVVDNNSREFAEKNETLESYLLTMQLIGLRSETVVGIIMADSFDENNFMPVEDKRFLYAPTAALLVKVGSRTSKFYNDFIDFGFGLAISTPDFNTDGTPEFGAGFMLTAFKDILSVGINYNVTLDTPYWSFGINLPFNLPGIPINSPE